MTSMQRLTKYIRTLCSGKEMPLKGNGKYILEGAWIRPMGSVVLGLLQYMSERSDEAAT